MEQKYIGIIPYDENSDFEFAGRTEETWTLYDRIVRNDYTVYYAASGEGKSSLIRAGLLPILRRRNYFPVYIVIEDNELGDIDSIEDVITNRIKVEEKKHNISYEQSEWSRTIFDPEQSEELSHNLWWKLRNYCFKRDDTEMTPLFIFDQFEEVFTKTNYEWTNRFFSWLEEISVDYVPSYLRTVLRGEIPIKKNFKALFSFRTEYLGDLDYWCVQKHFIPALQDNRMCLKALTPNGAREVINLNDALGKYADKIIQGCAESRTNVENENQPCVYALILSVVCQTLSEMPNEERDSFLENLNSNQDDTIDGILLRFYKKKLNEAGLDYEKDEKVIAGIEDALVDEKGKRSRRDTNEPSLLPLKEWIERLSDKKNGLIKVIGRKDINGETVKTVEFPHDRLCRAIDFSRKERQGKIAWQLKRQGEFIQFGIISVVMGILAFLWNALMPALKPVLVNLMHESRRGKVLELFVDNYLSFKKVNSKLEGFLLDEGFSTLLLMILLLLFVPLITIFIIRKGRKWQLLSSVISSFSTMAFTLLLIRNTSIDFTNSYVHLFTIIGLSASLMSMIYSLTRLIALNSRKWVKITHEDRHSLWPLWGGYFIFTSYIFYETLCRVTFGISEPSDSCWALSLLPLLFMVCVWGFFHATIKPKSRKKILTMTAASFLFLVSLSVISYLPYYNSFKSSYGMALSLSLILLWIYVFAYILWHARSRSKYYLLSNRKRIIATGLGSVVTLAAFFLNLGFNPFAIAPRSVWHVSAWRTVTVSSNDSLGQKKLGIVYSTTGETIIPCCISENEYHPSQRYQPIKSTFSQFPFKDSTFIQNTDHSLSWNSMKHQMTANIPSTPTLEQHLHRTVSRLNQTSESGNLAASINGYAAKLFSEIRDANIHFALTGETYNTRALTSLNQLDSLQREALFAELAILNDSITFISEGLISKRPTAEVLEDKYLVDIHRELSRSILLSLIRDRSSQSDMPAMFALTNTYLLAFFNSVPGMNTTLHFDFNFNFNDALIKSQYKISSVDILNKRLFAWSDLFSSLSMVDIGCNVQTYHERQKTNMQKTLEFSYMAKEYNKKLDEYNKKLDEYKMKLDEYKMKQEEYKKKLEEYKKISEISSLTDTIKDSLLYEFAAIFNEASKLKRDMPTYTYVDTSLFAQINEIESVLNENIADESLKQLKDTVVHTLLPIMERYNTGIYNNDFENICKNLIIVAAYRGQDVQNDIKSLSDYFGEKNTQYDIIANINKVNELFQLSLDNYKDQQRELISLLDKISKNILRH